MRNQLWKFRLSKQCQTRVPEAQRNFFLTETHNFINIYIESQKWDVAVAKSRIIGSNCEKMVNELEGKMPNASFNG